MFKKISKKWKALLLGLSIGCMSTFIVTGLYFYHRSILQYLNVKNKINQNTHTIKEIPFNATEFKEKWEQQKLSLDSPIFREYFEYELEHKQAKNALRNLVLSVSVSKDFKSLIVKATYKKAFGKDETKEFTLKGFTGLIRSEEIKKLEEFAKKIKTELNVLNKNKLASNADENDLSPINDPNKEKYNFSYAFIPNDELGKLKIKLTITHKEDSTITTIIEKDFDGFVLDKVDANALLNFNSNENIADLKDAKTVKDNVAMATDKKTKLKEFGIFDESKLNGLGYEITKIEILSATNIEDLKLTYVLTKKVIVGKDANKKFITKEIKSEEKAITVSFTKAIQNTYKKLINEYFDKIAKLVTKKEGYNKNKLASEFQNSDLNFPKIANENEYDIEIKDIDTSDVEQAVTFNYLIKTNKLKSANNIQIEKSFRLDEFKENLPVNETILTPKNDYLIDENNYSEYKNNIKAIQIINSYHNDSDGWKLSPISIKLLSKNDNKLEFEYQLYNNLKGFDGQTSLVKKVFTKELDFTGIIDKNTEFKNITKDLQVDYSGPKPMIDKVDVNKFYATYSGKTYKYYKATFVKELIRYNYKDGYLFIKAEIKEIETNKIKKQSDVYKITGFVPYSIDKLPINKWNEFKDSVIGDPNNFYTMTNIWKQYFDYNFIGEDSNKAINSIKSVLKNDGEFDRRFIFRIFANPGSEVLVDGDTHFLKFANIEVKRELLPCRISWNDDSTYTFEKVFKDAELTLFELIKKNVESNYKNILSELQLDANKITSLFQQQVYPSSKISDEYNISELLKLDKYKMSEDYNDFTNNFDIEAEIAPNDITGILKFRFKIKPGKIFKSSFDYSNFSHLFSISLKKYEKPFSHNLISWKRVKNRSRLYANFFNDIPNDPNKFISLAVLKKYFTSVQYFVPGIDPATNTRKDLAIAIDKSASQLTSDDKLILKYKLKHRVYKYNDISDSPGPYDLVESEQTMTVQLEY